MKQNTEFAQSKVNERLYQIYTSDNRKLLVEIQEIINPNAVDLANYFYTNLMGINESHQFLDHELVSKRLHQSMKEWIQSLFLPSDERSVAEHMKWQRTVGDVHARVNVPMRLVNHGIRLLKSKMGNLIVEADLEDSQKYLGLVLVNNLLDFSSSLINESYLNFRMSNERDMQALRTQMMSVSFVVELERLRSSLFDWLRKTITKIYSRYPEQSTNLDSVYTTDFGLWVIYKAELLLSDQPDLIDKLKSQMNSIEDTITKINQLEGHDSKAELSEAIDFLNESISNVGWLVGDFSTQAYEMESGRDPLTRLFNRRFLPSVLQSMIRVTVSTDSVFSILSCDLDNFKEINDRFGHDVGDLALIQFGDFLLSFVRATDYVFRLGGDEFLIILAGAQADVGTSIAKKMLERLLTHEFDLKNGTSVKLSASIGVVEYDGHPDYMRIIKSADNALYKAKNVGENSYYLES